jgi:hypothetical protein
MVTHVRLMLPYLISIREADRNAWKELFVRVDAGEHVRYIDITSHYPNICANCTLRMDHPIHLLGPEIVIRRLDQAYPDLYFGHFRGVVRMPKDDMYGSLPYRGAKNL